MFAQLQNIPYLCIIQIKQTNNTNNYENKNIYQWWNQRKS